MERIGCTTPFGLDLDNICTDQNKSLEAASLFWEFSADMNEVKECEYPCNFLMNWVTTTGYKNKTSSGYDGIQLGFDKYIKVTTSTYGYTKLELLAELGGYVGLFLGLSVFDLRLVFKKILNIFMPN